MREQNILGRTAKKWQPFASIPQQFKGISDIIENQNKIPKPLLEEDEQERINYNLVEAIETRNDVAMVYWINGRFQTEIGHIKKVDLLTDTVYFIDKFDYIQTIAISSLININFI
jgi:hypothetical protein